MFQVATNIGGNVSQIHAGRELTDELPAKSCISNTNFLSTKLKPRLAGILLLPVRFSILSLFFSVKMNYLEASPRGIKKANAQGERGTDLRAGVLNPKENIITVCKSITYQTANFFLPNSPLMCLRSLKNVPANKLPAVVKP
jgi:hypothetical protein